MVSPGPSKVTDFGRLTKDLNRDQRTFQSDTEPLHEELSKLDGSVSCVRFYWFVRWSLRVEVFILLGSLFEHWFITTRVPTGLTNPVHPNPNRTFRNSLYQDSITYFPDLQYQLSFLMCLTRGTGPLPVSPSIPPSSLLNTLYLPFTLVLYSSGRF